MIRIDEIYNNTFWPWMQENLPGSRIFFCDPPGHTSPANLFNYGRDDLIENNYLFMHDQEPVDIDLFRPLFDEVVMRNGDIIWEKTNVSVNPHSNPSITLNGNLPKIGSLVHSEYNSKYVTGVCEKYGWQPFYYFYHGWAALDWYRGYDKTFLIKPYDDRKIVKSFISPNRIIGGKREHRVLLMYELLKRQIKNAWISFPRSCPVENLDITVIANRFSKSRPDIVDVFDNAGLPYCFPGESDHPMHSCWLSLFNENTESLVHVITETVFTGQRNHLTEKTFKPICLKMPFVMVSTAGSLEYLRRYGFRTFSDLWSEDYDHVIDDSQRLKAVADLLKYLDDCSIKELASLHRHAKPIIEHNYRHFYGGDFENTLWTELTGMLDAIKLHTS